MEKPVVVYGIYFSASGFADEVETWLNDNGILTIDFNTWEKVMADLYMSQSYNALFDAKKSIIGLNNTLF